ncbi:hypothetical protein ACO0LM_13295 [Undibacterium sp. Di26W]|uniref:hypothetical protein n=1 Tax=Undibacterium sp. Di26W TaxID=3413035 RepID=UPI003BF022D1
MRPDLRSLTSEDFQLNTVHDDKLGREWFFSFANDPEIMVRGNADTPDVVSVEQINCVIEHLESLALRAVQLLETFMKDKGAWHLTTIDCARKASMLECDFVLSFCFEAERDPYEYIYTYFDVGFIVLETSPAIDKFGRPVKFLIGFQ